MLTSTKQIKTARRAMPLRMMHLTPLELPMNITGLGIAGPRAQEA